MTTNDTGRICGSNTTRQVHYENGTLAPTPKNFPNVVEPAVCLGSGATSLRASQADSCSWRLPYKGLDPSPGSDMNISSAHDLVEPESTQTLPSRSHLLPIVRSKSLKRSSFETQSMRGCVTKRSRTCPRSSDWGVSTQYINEYWSTTATDSPAEHSQQCRESAKGLDMASLHTQSHLTALPEPTLPGPVDCPPIEVLTDVLQGPNIYPELEASEPSSEMYRQYSPSAVVRQESILGNFFTEESANKSMNQAERYVYCATCGGRFSSIDAIEKHAVATHHRPFRCEERGCTHACQRLDLLTRHMKYHKAKSAFECLHCDDYRGFDAFKRRDALDQHMKRVHPKEWKAQLIKHCPYAECEYAKSRFKFHSAVQYRSHMANVHGEGKTDCPVEGCKRTGKDGFKRSRDLQEHVKSKHQDQAVPEHTKEAV